MADSIYEEQFFPDERTRKVMADFVAIVRQLRRDCPWDREQTHESVKHLLIEEAYETVEAIDEEDWTSLKEELGDLFLHVVFHAVMGAEDGKFDLASIVETESEKLVRRHPHVFGDVAVEGTKEVLQNWEQIKMKEGRKKSALEGVPRHLPALLRALRMQEKAAGVGFDFPEQEGAWEKVEEEIHEFRSAEEASAAEREEEFGDLLFALVNYARFQGINPENALQATNRKFVDRFQHVERRVAQSGQSMAEAELEEMDRYWEEAKEGG